MSTNPQQKTAQTRMEIIDGLKAIAVQFIVLHHLAAYGPLAEAAQKIAPDLMGWLYDHARIAVQIFLVIGGYLAARTLSPRGGSFSNSLTATIINRYLRLVPPYLAALLLAVACAAFARRWINDDDFISAAPNAGQWLAHLFLLNGILDYESLTAGAWYIAIDFQLFVLLAALLWLGKVGNQVSSRFCGFAFVGIFLLSAASLLWFNRNDNLDNWAVYFFGAYGLGALTYWAGHGERYPVLGQRVLWATAVLALMADFRWRLLVALDTALILNFAQSHLSLRRLQLPNIVLGLGRVSYALFLVHFPVYMLISALFVKYELLANPWSGIGGMALTWLLSLIVAFQLHRWIEMPTSRLKIMWASPRVGGDAILGS